MVNKLGIRYENQCCQCATENYPCLGNLCSRKKTEVHYCDECGDESVKVYKFGKEELCASCIWLRLEEVDLKENETKRMTNRKTKDSNYNYSTREMIKKLEQYEILEEQGLLVKLPCKIGDSVYCIMVSVKGTHPTIFSSRFDYNMIPMFGKYVFLTREQAEQALKEM